MARFDGKVVIVTGAGSGIGEGAARRFSAEGAMVVLSGRTAGKLEKAARGLDPERTLLHAADVSDPAQVQELIDATLRRFGRLDVLVNNAGIAVMGPVDDISLEDWRKVMATDVDGVFLCSKAALPELKKSRGSIVNVSSVSGLGGDWGMSAYNAAKGAVTNLTRAMALDLGPAGVRVNAVNPSFTASELTEEMLADEKLVAKFRERMPLGAPAMPDDIAGPILFLASEDARFVTGVNLPVDGGLMASNGQPPQA
ncbi:SDR family NAD(P)-dependent oxidoreductase [Pseudoroseomonas globiformis]|uniref:SDR family NAD(P)-dependent oxidoreductase n=1 Tax=Teichococcus globiformis TaxID=2307229 RepID=A0ABV7G0S1_9PROT